MTLDRKLVFDSLRVGVGTVTSDMVEILDEALDQIDELDMQRTVVEGKTPPKPGRMRMSPEGHIFLCNLEACVLSTYKDSKGIPTIGVGHTKAAGKPIPVKGLILSPMEAFALFHEDVDRYAADVDDAVKIDLQQHEFDALVSWHFNTGAVYSATLTKELNKGNRKEAARQMMRWTKPKEVTARRKKEQKLFLTGDYGDTSTITVFAKWPGKGRKVDVAELTQAQPNATV